MPSNSALSTPPQPRFCAVYQSLADDGCAAEQHRSVAEAASASATALHAGPDHDSDDAVTSFARNGPTIHGDARPQRPVLHCTAAGPFAAASGTARTESVCVRDADAFPLGVREEHDQTKRKEQKREPRKRHTAYGK